MTITIKRTYSELLNEVKNVLDNGIWDFEASNPRGNFEGANKAVHYLSTQKFSVSLIHKAIDTDKDTIMECIREQYGQLRYDTIPAFIARRIATDIAFDRISRFQKSNWMDYRTDNNKWYIDETVTFVIR